LESVYWIRGRVGNRGGGKLGAFRGRGLGKNFEMLEDSVSCLGGVLFINGGGRRWGVGTKILLKVHPESSIKKKKRSHDGPEEKGIEVKGVKLKKVALQKEKERKVTRNLSIRGNSVL